MGTVNRGELKWVDGPWVDGPLGDVAVASTWFGDVHLSTMLGRGCWSLSMDTVHLAGINAENLVEAKEKATELIGKACLKLAIICGTSVELELRTADVERMIIAMDEVGSDGYIALRVAAGIRGDT